MKDRNKLLEKIKKLLALSKSSNPHEAAKALALAQKLMAQNELNQSDIIFSEYDSKQKFALNTPRYIHNLSSLICRAFAVEGYFSNHYAGQEYGENKLHAVFFGKEERPMIASYCFDVLYRQLQKARQDFNANQSKRLKRSTLIARADNFCEGWVLGVYEIINEFVVDTQEKEEMQEQRRKLNEKRKLTKGRVREVGICRERDDNSRDLGYEQGKKAQLNRAVNGQETAKLGYAR